ncbi:MAG TPA: hypothetical protein VGJ44_02320 [Kribbellaceae bacterium]
MRRRADGVRFGAGGFGAGGFGAGRFGAGRFGGDGAGDDDAGQRRNRTRFDGGKGGVRGRFTGHALDGDDGHGRRGVRRTGSWWWRGGPGRVSLDGDVEVRGRGGDRRGGELLV